MKIGGLFSQRVNSKNPNVKYVFNPRVTVFKLVGPVAYAGEISNAFVYLWQSLSTESPSKQCIDRKTRRYSPQRPLCPPRFPTCYDTLGG